MFGGKNQNGDINNQLKVLILGKRPITWVNITTKGKIPDARYSHTLSFYREGNILVLVGGKNETPAMKDLYFSPLHIFSLQFLEWVKVDIKGKQLTQRYSHSVTHIDSKIMIFGGLDDLGICNSEL